MRTRLIFHCLTVTLLTLAVQAQAGKTPPAGCTEAASLVFALTSSPDPSLGSPVKMHASTPTLVIKNVGDDPHCEGDRRIPEESWIWSLDVPLGSHAQLTNANTLTTILDVSFTPDIPGNYTVHLNGCGNQCSVTLVTDIVGKKIIKETVDIADAEHRIVINVLPQVRPHIIPPNQPSPLTEGPNPHREPATAPEHYEKATDFCGNKALLGIGLRPFHIRHTGDHVGRGGDKVASWLNFDPYGAPCLLAEVRLRGAQEVPKGGQVGCWGSGAIRMRNATAEVDGLHLRVDVQTGGKKADQLLHIGGKLRHRRPRAM